MSFLSKLEKVGQIAGAVAAPIMIGFGVHPDVADAVAGAISEASAFDGATDAQKKQHVMTVAKDVIQAVNGQVGHAEVDEQATLSAVDNGIDTAFQVAHVIHASKLEDAAEQASVQSNQSTGAILEKASVLSQQRSVVTENSVSSVHPDFKE